MKNVTHLMGFLAVFLFSSSVFAQQTPFVTVWTTGTVSSSIQIPAVGSGYTIQWKELSPGNQTGTVTAGANATFTSVTFPENGTYEVSISPGTGTFTTFCTNNTGDAAKLTTVTQWGNTAWTTWYRALYNCVNMTVTATDIPNLSGPNINMTQAFSTCTALTTVPNMNSWNMVNVTNMYQMFLNDTHFNEPIGGWNTSNVTDMTQMFGSASSFNQPIGNWNVSNVTSMQDFLYSATAFNQNVGKWIFKNGATLKGILNSTSLSCQNYDATLQGWATSNQPSGLTLGVSGLQYGSAAQAYHNTLTTTKGWTLTGDQLGTGCPIALPIILTSFDGRKNNNTIVLDWNSSTEINAKGYGIQRSSNGSNFTNIGFIKATGPGQYTFTDSLPLAGTNYYRLAATDLDGSVKNSTVINVTSDASTPLSVYPNPAISTLNVNVSKGGLAAIYNAAGAQVRQIQLNTGTNTIDVSTLSSGLYFLKTSNNEHAKFIKK